MALIGLQAGHQNIQRNSDPTLASETGAPGEEQLNVAVRDYLSEVLQAYDFQVQLDDANANEDPNTTGKDFDFYLALHAEGSPPGGNIVAPDPAVDESNAKSVEIVNALKSVYFADSGIENNGIETANETEYYMWRALSGPTPCGIIEMGDLADPHDSVILADHRRVALALAHGFCNAFGKEWKGFPLEQAAPEQPQEPTAPVEPANPPEVPQEPATPPVEPQPEPGVNDVPPPVVPLTLPQEHQDFLQELIAWIQAFFQKKNE